MMFFLKTCNVLINFHDNEIGDSSVTDYCHNSECVLELVIPTLKKFAGYDEDMTVTSEIGG